MENVYLPELGEGIEKATVACWHAAIGDQVSGGDDIVELVTDKATFNVPAGVFGVVQRICVQEGQEAKMGDVLAVIDASAQPTAKAVGCAQDSVPMAEGKDTQGPACGTP